MRSPGRPPGWQRDQFQRFWVEIAKGTQSEEAAVAVGVASAVGSRWFRHAGGMRPISLCPLSGRYLSLNEREEIAILKARGSGVRGIARQVGRSPSTISRELRRNAATRPDSSGYRATAAQWHADRRAKRPKVAKLASNDSRTAPAVPCDVIGIDAANDLALLKTERPLVAKSGDEPPYARLDSRTVGVGTIVKVTGYPAFSWQPVTQSGHVTWIGQTHLEETAPDFPPSDALMMEIRLRGGNSGSPVYIQGGEVIGMVDKRDSLRPALSIALAIHYAIELAQRYAAPWHGVD